MWKVAVDTGGTFTDCIAVSPKGERTYLKLLSSSCLRGFVDEVIDEKTMRIRSNWSVKGYDFAGYKLVINGESTIVTATDADVFTLKSSIAYGAGDVFEITGEEEVPVFAARLLTSTPLHKPVPPLEMRLGFTKGTNALLERKGGRVAFLVTKGFKDLIRIGNQQRPDLFALNIQKPGPLYAEVFEIEERIDHEGRVIVEINKEQVQRVTAQIQDNFDAVAIAFINSYKNSDHENYVARQVGKAGINYISASASLSNDIKILSRAETAIVNAYLQPVINEYVKQVSAKLKDGKLFIMASSGSLVDVENFEPKESLLSGPAGGIVGASAAGIKNEEHQLLAFDMGGTSTDVAIYDNAFDYSFETLVGDAHILAPSLSIYTIAAGGGSICSYKNGLPQVGPESAGADPGPACYGQGGPLSMSDINLLAGHLVEDSLNIPLERPLARQALKDVTGSHNAEGALLSFLSIANEKMASAIKSKAMHKGADARKFTLISFGGAGGQHACAIADILKVKKIIVPYEAGLLSAEGIRLAVIERFAERTILKPLDSVGQTLDKQWNELDEAARKQLIRGGFDAGQIDIAQRLVFLRFKGQETSIEVKFNTIDQVKADFKAKYKNLYGHWLDDGTIEVASLRASAVLKQPHDETQALSMEAYEPQPVKSQKTLFKEGWKETAIYQWEELKAGATIAGPAILTSSNSTILVEPGWCLKINEYNQACLAQKNNEGNDKVSLNESAEIELYKNRFAGVVEQMGAILQRTSFSVNIKERLDFSCALLNAEGRLMVNAPHIPVHLGSMGLCVRKVIEALKLKEGDVAMTNHPGYGGSHLPDVTLIAPVFYDQKLIGYMANRSHHAEIGGKTPGSMPTDATSLKEEGVVIEPQLIADKGNIDWEKVEAIFLSGPYPSRNVKENLADLQGALASINYGVRSMQSLCKSFGMSNVQKHMSLLYGHVTNVFNKSLKQLPKGKFSAQEKLDDGALLVVTMEIRTTGTTIDFSGTSAMHPGNFNATPAIVQSVVLYVLRLIVNENIPLNEGLLENVKVNIPLGTLLNPDFKNHSPAVVGGNTEVSQRLTDTLLKVLGKCGCSQGTMNNLLFGNDKFGYYETICGGTGAGEGFDGESGVHQHMTNTRITDPEIMEVRYPVRLDEFSLRSNSGGLGKYKGGEGVIRKLTFLDDMTVTLLSQHRIERPYGMQGGEPGAVGEQFILSKKMKQKVGGSSSFQVTAGDQLVIKTPGGGGYGPRK